MYWLYKFGMTAVMLLSVLGAPFMYINHYSTACACERLHFSFFGGVHNEASHFIEVIDDNEELEEVTNNTEIGLLLVASSKSSSSSSAFTMYVPTLEV